MSKHIGTMSLARRVFAHLISACVILGVISGCVTARRCIEKFPPQMHIDTVETVLIIDTTIYVQLPADTIIDSITVEVAPDYLSDIVFARGEYATARAWIAGERLRVQLTMNDTLLAWHIDSLATLRTKTITIEKERVLEVKHVPPFYKALIWIAVFLFLLILFMFYLAWKR